MSLLKDCLSHTMGKCIGNIYILLLILVISQVGWGEPLGKSYSTINTEDREKEKQT